MPRFEIIRAFTIHVFTACGVALAFACAYSGDGWAMGGDCLLALVWR